MPELIIIDSNMQISCEIDIRTLTSHVFCLSFFLVGLSYVTRISTKYIFYVFGGQPKIGYPLTTINIAKRYLFVNDYRIFSTFKSDSAHKFTPMVEFSRLESSIQVNIILWGNYVQTCGDVRLIVG